MLLTPSAGSLPETCKLTPRWYQYLCQKRCTAWLHYQCIYFPSNNLLGFAKEKEHGHPTLLLVLVRTVWPGAAKTRNLKGTAASSPVCRSGMQKTTTTKEAWTRSREVPRTARTVSAVCPYLGELYQQSVEMRLSCFFQIMAKPHEESVWLKNHDWSHQKKQQDKGHGLTGKEGSCCCPVLARKVLQGLQTGFSPATLNSPNWA